MKDTRLNAAIAEAERFLERARRLAANRAADKAAVEAANRKPHAPHERRYTDNFPKDSGAVRRASLDLTRALADLRRPA